MMHWVWWLVGTVGFGGAIMIAVGFVFGWPIIIGTKLGRIALAVFTAGISILVLYGKARNEGARAERDRQERENDDFLDQMRRRDADIEQLGDAELDRVLHDSREPKAGDPGGQANLPHQ